jgi:hypothetical protein
MAIQRRDPDVAHWLSFRLRAAEERARELQFETKHFRDLAAIARELADAHSQYDQIDLCRSPSRIRDAGADLPR